MDQTDRHLVYRFKEHSDRPQPVKKYFLSCGIGVREEDVVVVASTYLLGTDPDFWTFLFVQRLKV